jgi:hypothetical protein
MECREWKSKKTVSYKIRRNDGSIIEKYAEEITLNAP